MIVIMRENATEKQMKQAIDLVTGAGLTTQASRDNRKTMIGLIDDIKKLVGAELTVLKGVEKSVRISLSYRLTNHLFHPENTVVDVSSVKIGDGSMTVMAGPRSTGSSDQIRECAWIAKAGGATILRGGAFKPRTSPYVFQGLEEEGLKYTRQAVNELDIRVITEVTDEANLELVTKYSDVLQIGARNIQNFKLLQAAGRTGKPTSLKHGIAGTIGEWLSVAECIIAQEDFNVIFTECRVCTYEAVVRNTLNLSAVPLAKKLSHFPVIIDPSHGVGIRDLIPLMARAGIASDAGGLAVEIHPDPANARSDGPQSLSRKTYLCTMEEVHIIEKAMEGINALED